MGCQIGPKYPILKAFLVYTVSDWQLCRASKRRSNFTNGKVIRRFFYSFLRELKGKDKFINCSINFLRKLVIFYTGIGHHKVPAAGFYQICIGN